MSKYTLDDTIAAISTPPGEGGIGIVRMSGPDSQRILCQIFVPANRDEGDLEPRRLRLGYLVDPHARQRIDEVLAVFMPSPHTYTRQDVVEIDCHGGIMPTRRILEACLCEGARLAMPGEFTLRAFVNGRVDLAQAEAVLDTIRARTDEGLQVAVGQLTGALSRRVRAVRETLLRAQVHVVASIDFPEDEIPSMDVAAALTEARDTLTELLEGADQGIIYRQGVHVAIVGRPNVGKSSILNALLRTNRAIVTPIPGTTRDTVEETLNLQGIPMVLVDTAGLDASPRDCIEQLGIERSLAALQQADLALAVIDGSAPLEPEDLDTVGALGDRPALLAINKADLGLAIETDRLPAGMPRVTLSALTGEGLPELESALAEMVLGGQVSAATDLLVSHPRHKQALSAALQGTKEALQAHQDGLPADFISIDLAEAIHALGEITGETADEELLDRIFGEFCIGK